MTLGVRHLAGVLGQPVFVTGTLCVDVDGTRLFDPDDARRSVPIADPGAVAAVRAAVGGDCLSAAMIHAWVRAGTASPELHTVYRVQLFTGAENGRIVWGVNVGVRAVPAEFDMAR